MKTSPTQRSLKFLKECGYQVAITERWNPFAHIRQDLFGFIDLLAVHPGIGCHTVAVQTTSSSNMSARVKKIRASPLLPAVLNAGWHVVVHGWKKNKSGHWEVRAQRIGGPNETTEVRQ